MTGQSIPVKVALRIRPLIEREVSEGCQSCIRTVPGESQVILGQDRPFTYDYVFGQTEAQGIVYEKISKELIESIFKGINATILAYGQTGSGKTFTMGGCYESSLSGNEDEMGIIPRVLLDIFKGTEEREETIFTIKVSYMEIYNEEVFDLLCPSNQRDSLSIKEEVNGAVKIPGLSEVQVSGYKDTMGLLSAGSVGRTTGATAMNSTSSRSHAVFTLHMEQKKKDDENDVCNMKFQLVDLAGSERCKRTGAEGDRFKEGVNINKGLLVLGNVISALGKKQPHIPYRDAKLTRILQDSLGGNSHTVMIACVSPADTNIEETLNTLRYADRARKIKNKPIINRDPQAAEVMRLKMLVQQLQCQLMGNATSSTLDSTATSNTTVTNDRSLEEINKLKDNLANLKEENARLTRDLHESFHERTRMMGNVLALEEKMERLKENAGIDFDVLSSSINIDDNPKAKAELEKLSKLTETIKEDDESQSDDLDDEKENQEEDGDENMDTEQMEDGTFVNTAENTRAKEHLMKQAEFHRQLTEMTNMLKEKQSLADKMNLTDGEIENMKQKYAKQMKELEEQVAVKQKEIDELKGSQTHTKNNVTKLSEQRRQRLQQLEGEVQQLRKKMNDQDKVVKMKQKSDVQVTKLNNEITAMKQQRVRLMKQMKEEQSSFQKWKKEKDKELIKLKQKDTKREFQLKKLQNEYDKQQNVLKRKNAEAIAANKRLRDALSKRNEIEAEKTTKLEKYDATSVGNRVRKWLSHELDLKSSMAECKYRLEDLIEERKSLTQQLQQLSEELQQGPLMEKFSWLGDAGDPDDILAREEGLKEKMKELQMHIHVINVQITEIQQRIVEADQDLKGKSTWQSLHTMTEAKCALKFLLEQAVSAKAENSRTHNELTNVVDSTKVNDDEKEERLKVLETTVRGLKSSMSQINCKHEREMDKLTNEYEEKILFLLNADQSCKGTPSRTPKGTPKSTKSIDQVTKERLKLLESQVKNVDDLKNRLQQVETQLEEKEKECESLQRSMTCSMMYRNKQYNLLPDETNSSPFLHPTLKKSRRNDSEERKMSHDSTFVLDEGEEKPQAKSPTPSPTSLTCPNTVTVSQPKMTRFTRSSSNLKAADEKLLPSSADNSDVSNTTIDLEQSGLMKRKSDSNDDVREKKYKRRKRPLLNQNFSGFD